VTGLPGSAKQASIGGSSAKESPPMPTPSLPRSLADLLAAFGPCFTQPTFRTFQALVAGFLTQPGQRTVTGMLVGARLAGRRHHDLAYRFFATACWSADQLGLTLLDLIAAMLVPVDAAVVLAVDDTLWRRSGRKLHGVAWHHDGAGPGRHRPAWGHRWVVVGVICHLPFLSRAVCLPILARLWLPGDPDRTPLLLARGLLDLVTGHLGDRPVHLVGDAAYVGKPLQALPAHVTVTARLRCDAALYQPAPPPTGRRGRPRRKGDRLPELVVLAAMTRYQWTPVRVRCYAKTLEREVLALRCLWYGALKGQPVQVVLSRPQGAPDGYELALVTTDLAATPAAVIERYANRWSAEQAFLDARHLVGVGQARTRTKRSVERLVPFGLCCLSLAICWYARHGQPAHDLAAHRTRAPWYRHKRTVSVADMLTALRRTLLAAQYQHGHLDPYTLDLFPDLLLTQLDPAA
jgi:DDE superfamily endonuclease